MTRLSTFFSLAVALLASILSVDAFADGIQLGGFLCDGEDTYPVYQTVCNLADELANVTLPQAPEAEGEEEEEEEEEPSKQDKTAEDPYTEVNPAGTNRRRVRGA